jgi:hypothetical protein
MLYAEAARDPLFRSSGGVDDLEKFEELCAHWMDDLCPTIGVLTVRSGELVQAASYLVIFA